MNRFNDFSQENVLDMLPEAPKGFDHINRYWDAQRNMFAAKIVPGEYYVSTQAEIVTTVLGSCIAVCVWDTQSGIGGMNHFMLPSQGPNSSGNWGDTPVGSAARYGNVAMERLINAVIINGGSKARLAMKVFGGARVLDIESDVGQKNIDFIMKFIEKEGYPIHAYDVGGPHPRKIVFYAGSGRVRLRKLYNTHNLTLKQREAQYYRKLRSQAIEGEVTLF